MSHGTACTVPHHRPTRATGVTAAKENALDCAVAARGAFRISFQLARPMPSPTSPVWKHFDVSPGTEGDKAACLYCEFKCGKSQTLQARCHFAVEHRIPLLERQVALLAEKLESVSVEVPHEATEEKYTRRDGRVQGSARGFQPRITQALPGPDGAPSALAEEVSRARAAASNGDNVINEAIASFMVHANLPANVFNSPHFKYLVNLLTRRGASSSRPFLVADRTALMGKHLDVLYNRTVENMKSKLAAADVLCATTDIWTDRQFRAMQNVSVTFLDQDWNMIVYTLDTISMPESHTGNYLAERFKLSAEKFGIMSKVKAVSTDAHPNNGVMSRILGVAQIKCWAHKLNLVVTDVLLPVKGKKGFKLIPEDPVKDTHANVVQAIEACRASEGDENEENEEMSQAAAPPARRSARRPAVTERLRESGLWTPALRAINEEREMDLSQPPQPADGEEDEDEGSIALRFEPLDIMERCTKMCTTFTGSVKLINEARKAVSGDDVAEKAMTRRYGETRWGSILAMIKPLVKHQASLTHVLITNGHEDRMLSATDFAKAQALVDALEPFDSATTVLQTTKATMHMVLPQMAALMGTLLPSPELPTYEKLLVPLYKQGEVSLAEVALFRENVKRSLRCSLAARIRSLSETEALLVNAASILNPVHAFARLSIEDVGRDCSSDMTDKFGKNDKREIDKRAGIVKLALSSLGFDLGAFFNLSGADDDSDDGSDSDSDVDGNDNGNDAVIVGLRSYYATVGSRKNNKLQIHGENDDQTKLRKVDTMVPGNLESVWRALGDGLDVIARRAARVIHAMMASSATSERLYSLLGLICSALRTRLHQETATKLVVVKSNGAAAAQDSKKRYRSDNITFAGHPGGADLDDKGVVSAKRAKVSSL